FKATVRVFFDEISQCLLHIMDRFEMVREPLREKETRDAEVPVTVPVHARMLKDGIRPRRLRVSAIVADEEVSDRHATAEFVSAHENVKYRVKLDFINRRG